MDAITTGMVVIEAIVDAEITADVIILATIHLLNVVRVDHAEQY